MSSGSIAGRPNSWIFVGFACGLLVSFNFVTSVPET
jgi:hypothetical protein